MRIALVHSYYSSDSPSGENMVVDSQMRALSSAGHEVALFDRHTDTDSDLRLYRLRSAVSAAGYGTTNPVNDIEAFGPDVVHIHNLFPNWGTRWLSRVSAPIVSTLHNYRSVCASAVLWRDGQDCTDCVDGTSLDAVRHKCYRESTAATLPLAWATRSRGKHSEILNNSDALITLNHKAAEFFSELRPHSNIYNVPNFAEEDFAQGNVEISESWIYVGRLVPEKGIRWLLEHWPHSQNLILVGSGPLEQEVRAKAYAEPGRFTYTGKLGRSETRRLIGAAKGIVIPSLWSEGIPTVALEALQTGTPILISENCSSAADLTAGGAGQTFRHSEGLELFDQKVHGISVSGDMRRAARRLYEYEFSEAVWLNKVTDVYSSVQ